MSLFSLAFVLFSLAFVLLIRASSSHAWKGAVFLIANALFLGSFMNSVSAALPLAGFLVLGYCAVLTVRRFPSRNLVWGWTAALVLLFAWLRSYSLVGFLPSLPAALVTVGLSYILFRVLHLLFDVQEGAIEGRIGVVDYLNFTAGFLSLVSGPIDRFQTFVENFNDHTDLVPETIRAALGRIAIGYGKVLILSAAARYVFDNLEPQLLAPEMTSTIHLVGLYCGAAAAYTMFLYTNFSGYMDIVIGIGLLAGIRLPENFDKPFQTRSQIEFWGRWHMTLSNWFKQYAFYPILQALMKRWPSAKAAPLLGVLTYFIVFLMIGVWHGSTSIFVLYGFVLGLGVSLNKLWQVLLAGRLGNKGYRALSARPAYQIASRGLNIGFFMVALSAFWLTFGQLGELSGRMGLAGWALSFMALCVGWAAVATVTDKILGIGGEPRRWVPSLRAVNAGNPAPLSFVSISLILFACVAVQTMVNAEPEFVYANF
jgi:D-alanyl-lipoteichoic acid acyltransferase DltB (MBOAT superfamily)